MISEIDICKQNYINKRNYENRMLESNKLTDEQIEIVEWLCYIRHYIHINADKYFTNCTNANWYYFDDQYNSKSINHRLVSVGLPPVDWHIDYHKIETSEDFDYYENWQDYEDRATELGTTAFDLWLNEEEPDIKCYEHMEEFNIDIENYLRKIDEENGTDYAPTGIARYNYY